MLQCAGVTTITEYTKIGIERNKESRCSSYLPRPFAETETKKTNVSNMVVQTQQKKKSRQKNKNNSS